MTAVLFGLLAALANTAQAVISKELTYRAPARQLIGVLYAGNALVLLPFAPFVTWVWSPSIVGLHLLSVALMVLTAICVWDLFDHGAASATTTATAMSPIPTVLAAAVVLPSEITPLQVVAAVVVVAGVLLALADAFAGLDRWGRTWRIVGAAVGTGILTVVTSLLGDEGSGLIETYVVRTALAAVVCIALFPPRDVDRADVPATPVAVGRGDDLFRLRHPRRAVGQPGRRPDPGGDDAPVRPRGRVLATALLAAASGHRRSGDRPRRRHLDPAVLRTNHPRRP